MHSSGNTFLNAVVGAVASLVLVFLPFSPAVGGAAAGYLQRGTTTNGATAGAVTGLLVAFPLFLLVVLLAPVLLFAPAGVRTVLGVPLPAVTAMVGTFVGLAVLLWMVLKGRAHAGLPLLNGGSIAGYLLGAVVAGIGLVEALGLGPYV